MLAIPKKEAENTFAADTEIESLDNNEPEISQSNVLLDDIELSGEELEEDQ